MLASAIDVTADLTAVGLKVANSTGVLTTANTFIVSGATGATGIDYDPSSGDVTDNIVDVFSNADAIGVTVDDAGTSNVNNNTITVVADANA